MKIKCGTDIVEIDRIKESIEKSGFKGYISKPINNIEVESIYASIVKQ